MYNFWFDRFGNHRVTPIIHPGKLKLFADAMRGGLPDLLQEYISAGNRMMAISLMYQYLWFVLFSNP